MDAAGALQLQVLVLVDEVQKIRLMLEEVRVQLFVAQRHIRLHIVAELHDLQLDVLLRQHGLDLLQDFRVRDRRSADFQRDLRAAGRCGRARGRGLFVPAAATGRENDQEQRGEKKYQFFHLDFPSYIKYGISFCILMQKKKAVNCGQPSFFYNYFLFNFFASVLPTNWTSWTRAISTTTVASMISGRKRW